MPTNAPSVTQGTLSIPLHPVLKRGLRRLRRDRTTVQLGIDPAHAVVLSGLDERAVRWLDDIDGTRDRGQLVEAAAIRGIPVGTALALLDQLGAAGLLTDASADRALLIALPTRERERLQPDLAAMALARGAGDGGLGTLRRRRAAVIEVHGGGRVGASAATLLAAAGIGHVIVRDTDEVRASDAAPAGLSPAETGGRREIAVTAAIRRLTTATLCALPRGRRPDLVLLSPSGPLDPRVPERLVRIGIPHLLAAVRETTGIVGPLVLPGTSSCLRCHDLLRADRDRAWPVLAAQLTTEPGLPEVRPCDTVLATAVAVHAVFQALAHIDGDAVGVVDGTLEIAQIGGTVRRRSWPAHPFCGCQWAQIG